MNKLEIVASGAGSVKLEVKGSDVDVEASGAARLELKGEVEQFDLEMSSAATLKAWELRVKNCDAEISRGLPRQKFLISGQLEAEISSAGILIYDGTLRITKQNVTGRGTLVKRR